MALELTERMTNGLPMAMDWREEGQTFAWVLRRYRKLQGLTQEELAEKWGYSFETISAWEREKRFPARTEIARLAHLLGIGVEELAEMLLSRRVGQGRTGEQRVQHTPVARVAEGPPLFERGRLFWTLHLGMEHGRLQCVITCPLASGEMWEVSLDSMTDGEAIRWFHQMVHEQVSKVAGGSSVQAGG
jgi:transcriptional regulator with XRE-family HTH domain